MRPLSQTFAIALKEYAVEVKEMNERNVPEAHTAFMCTSVGHLYQENVLTYEEFNALYSQIQNWIDYQVTLRLFLHRKGATCDRAACLAFYREKMKELKALEKTEKEQINER